MPNFFTRIMTFALLFGLSTRSFAQSGGLDEAISRIFEPIANPIVNVIFYSVPIAGVQFPLIVGWLVICGLVATIFFKFIQFRGFKHAIDLVRGRYSKPGDAGEVSHFQALTTALSGTVGLGNIAGVAVAVSIGGAGATFWMILAGLLGMASKFTECILGQKYRNELADGKVSGGPMYYLERGLREERNLGGLGKFFAIVFAICCIGGALGGGNMFQANQAYSQIVNVTGGTESFWVGKGWLFGLLMAVVVGSVIIGGIKSIGRVTEKLIPTMAGIYFIAGMIIIAANIDMVGWAFGEIFRGAFTGEGVVGGVLGALIQGFRRAAFSNEAGIGSAAIAHSAARTSEPVSEGFVALLEPFIDTVVICTMTALVIIISGALLTDLTGVELTSAAYATVLPWFPVVLAVAVVLFALSTMFAWSYYGLKSWTYLVGEGKTKENAYNFVFCLFIILGASMSLGPVIDFSDSMLFAMAIPNIIGIYLLLPVVKREVNKYWAKIESGEIERVK